MPIYSTSSVSIISFASVILTGQTTLAVTLDAPMPDTNYVVVFAMPFTNTTLPNMWVTSLTTTGFTLNLASGITTTVILVAIEKS